MLTLFPENILTLDFSSAEEGIKFSNGYSIGYLDQSCISASALRKASLGTTLIEAVENYIDSNPTDGKNASSDLESLVERLAERGQVLCLRKTTKEFGVFEAPLCCCRGTQIRRNPARNKYIGSLSAAAQEASAYYTQVAHLA